ncbi:protein unc-13 homolog isoform X1 [Primulina eburnea]|uniref:protein unc-13 homolog isoform X1 n=2 Tax=Primulina eburnea TaxID=1245227 RepID=UPI003C6C5EE6
MEFSNPTLRKYRDDRRRLLEFVLSSGLIKEIRTPAGPTTSFSSINFDSISTDYVLECINSGGVLDVSQARKRYYDESSQPITFLQMHLRSGDVYYLHSDPNSMGSPPFRMPPPMPMNHADFVELRKSETNYPAGKKSPSLFQETRKNCQETTVPDLNCMGNTTVLSAVLPTLKTGFSDDDLRESAYEVFLACMMFSRVEIYSTEAKKRERSARFLGVLNNRREKRHVEHESPDRNLKIHETIRMQMQISEATDTLIRRRLTQFASSKPCGDVDVPQLSLALLTGILRTDFPSEKSYIHWKNRQANVLEELLSSDHNKNRKQMIGASLAKIRNPEEWDLKMSPSERSDFLLVIRQVALALSSMPGRFGIEGETYYWTTGYHLNIRLYEKILCSVFDILEDSQIIEESEEILELTKLTWSMLGITQKLHHALFAWVLFQQFVATEDMALLDYSLCEVDKVLSAEMCDDREVAYTNSLTSFTFSNGHEMRLSLMQSIFLSISSWCDSKLQDYHLHFSKKKLFFERVVTMALSAGNEDFVPHINSEQFTGAGTSSELVTGKIRGYVEKSLDAACRRVSFVLYLAIINFCDCNHNKVDLWSQVTYSPSSGYIKDTIHPLVTLANELNLIVEEDLSIFSPVLSQWYRECAMISAKKLHQFYGERLKPFLQDVTCLTMDVRKVLSAAVALEACLTKLHTSVCNETKSPSANEPAFDYFPIAEISGPIILDWIVAQHERILEWTARAFELEDWEPLSLQQKQAASAVEVFRIIEETVDQFFEFSLPMDITHLQALLSVIFHSLDAYLSKMSIQLVEKKFFYPSTPLTRYKEAAFPIVKKKVVEHSILDDEVHKQLDILATSKLCIRLNTYRYIQKQITVLEDGIRKSWEAIIPCRLYGCQMTPGTLGTSVDLNDESVTELFVATLDCIRDSAGHAIKRTCDFLGAKIVFWDMRDSFLFNLYHGGVEGNRLDDLLPQFDSALNNVCRLIDETIRDLVVSSIYKASLEGFVWLLLDGGPSRAFSDTDISMIEEDLSVFEDLFVANGEGLPRSLIEEESKFVHQILSLFSLQTQSVIQMLMESSEHISVDTTSPRYAQRYLGDAETLIRVLCHKKDREASKFLKRHYQLPPSSDYGETSSEDSSFHSPLLADIVKRSASFRWSDKSQSSFKFMKKKLQEATWDIKHVTWSK